MPVCPKCTSTFHEGAEESCPACGYSLKLLDAYFGSDDYDFTRVYDAAGIFTHKERQSLIHYLESLERRIAPAVLGIYTTNRGRVKEFRPFAHWLFNHARIHHASFGPRNRKEALDTSSFNMRRPSRPKAELQHQTTSASGAWDKFCALSSRCLRNVRELFSKPQTPATQEWMLLLVIDVQLESACFVWGYMLDPYVDAERINSSIFQSRMIFRERQTQQALRATMKAAVAQIAQRARRVNKSILRQLKSRATLPALMLTLLLSPFLSAQESAELSPSTTAYECGRAASYAQSPRWSTPDYQALMSGQLWASYQRLFAAQEGVFGRAPQITNSKDISLQLARGYAEGQVSYLIDPQQLLSEPEQRDILYLLEQLNAKNAFRIYVSVFGEGQNVPADLSPDTLISLLAQPCEYAVLVQYQIGKSDSILLGYQELKLEEETRHEWLRRVRLDVVGYSYTPDVLNRAILSIESQILPMAPKLKAISPDQSTRLPHVAILPQEDTDANTKESKLVMLLDVITHPEWSLYLLCGVSFTLSLLVYWLWYWWFHRFATLLQTPVDRRLSSPYGATVSRSVRYLEGEENLSDIELS